MDLPHITKEDINKLIPEAKDIGTPLKGGQRLVFPIKIKDKQYALKIMLIKTIMKNGKSEKNGENAISKIAKRAKREVDILKKCDSPYIIKAGSIQLTTNIINNQNIIYFSEEWIYGQNLKDLLKNGPLSINKLINLGVHITEAIKAIWSFNKIHRDIKPRNIMLRDATGDFVLLDMGIAFDLQDETLTKYGVIYGTVPYFSPEQTDISKRRQMDFRSDLFSLGIVLYEAATGHHPFWKANMTEEDIIDHINNVSPVNPRNLRSELPSGLDTIIARLLAKKPHLRYGNCDILLADIRKIHI